MLSAHTHTQERASDSLTTSPVDGRLKFATADSGSSNEMFATELGEKTDQDGKELVAEQVCSGRKED